MPETSGFRQTLFILWLRLVTVGALTLLIIIVPQLQDRAVGWSFYLSGKEVAFEIAAYVVGLALCGLALGTLATACAAPFLLGGSSRQRVASQISKVAVVVSIFIALYVVIGQLTADTRHPRIVQAVYVIFCLSFAAALLLPAGRRQLKISYDGLMDQKVTRRTAIGIGVASAGLVSAELVMARGNPPAVAQPLKFRSPGRNVLLITFDSMCAGDMSLYGYALRTTPNIERFAERSSVFTNFYSTSTFTTPTVASVLTGLYPSQHGVYHLEGRLRGDKLRKTLPRLIRAAGKATGAAISSPYVYYLNQDLAADYDVLPDVAYRAGDVRSIWNATEMLHQRQPYGSRIREFIDFGDLWDAAPQFLEKHGPDFFTKIESGYPPAGSFAQAREVIERLPDGHFAWVHLMAPHNPYLPGAKHSGQFLHTGEMRGAVDQNQFPWPFYRRDVQPLVDKARLRYDEFIADVDEEFGRFITAMEGSGRLRDTTVIVSADHGESFEGRIFGHGHLQLTLPQIHIPLIIRTPGQETGRRVHVTADQTSMAPTILEAAGVPRPEWMRGESLIPWLTQDGGGKGQGWAFTQWLANNSTFKPVTNGSAGVIHEGYQYMVNFESGKALLRPLSDAHGWDADYSAENPELAQALREAICLRFPDLPIKHS
jgi:arylsulfatase A-like enzyme